MAPRKKKQKARPAPSAADDIVPDMTLPASERLPNELLQLIFEYLSFYDLIRCTQVSRTWARCLPGDHSKLREALFLRGDQSANTEGPLRLEFNFRIVGNVVRLEDNVLPILLYGFFEEKIKCDTGGSTCVNPIISRHEQLYHIVHSGHQPHKLESFFLYGFDTLERLRSITTRLKHITDCGTWRKMLVCVPAVTKLNVIFSVSGVGTINQTRTLEDRRGVRMQSLVALIRAFLQEVGDVVKADAPKVRVVDRSHGYEATKSYNQVGRG